MCIRILFISLLAVSTNFENSLHTRQGLKLPVSLVYSFLGHNIIAPFIDTRDMAYWLGYLIICV